MKKGWELTHEHLIGQTSKRDCSDEALENAYDGLLVWIPGSMEGIHPAFTMAVKRKTPALSLGLYPYTIFWCNSFVQKSLEVLDTIFDSCEKRAGRNAPHLDSLIEQQVQGVGRALWCDIEMSARRAVWGTGERPYEPEESDSPPRVDPGYVARFFADIVQLKVERGCKLHESFSDLE